MFRKFILLVPIIVAGGFAVLLSISLIPHSVQPPDSLPPNKLPTAVKSPLPIKQTIYAENIFKNTLPEIKPVNANKATKIVAAPINEFPEKLISPTEFTVDGKNYPLRKYSVTALPNDPSAQQWWVSQSGLPTAWNYGKGANVTIAIIDTGFGLKHEELVDRWLINVNEVGPTNQEAPNRLNCTDQHIPLDMSCNNIDNDHDGIVSNEYGPTTKENPSWLNCSSRNLTLDKSCNGLDNDGNGYPSDFKGWDFSSGDANVLSLIHI